MVQSSQAVDAATRFIGERILSQRRFFVIYKAVKNDAGNTIGYQYVSFDDPTGGNDGSRVDIAAGESPGPVRTMLAFTSPELAEEYIHEELHGVGSVTEFIINGADMGRFFGMMMKNQIRWLTVDRVPGNHRSEIRYTCWLIPLQFFAKVVGKYVDSVDRHMRGMAAWTPGDGMVVEIDEETQNMIRKTRND